MKLDTPRILKLALILGVGLVGALSANLLGFPIPFLLGSLTASATLSLLMYARTRQRLQFPLPLRNTFVAVIGTMIGTTFSPEALALIPSLGLTLSAMVLFLVLAQVVGYLIFRYLGRYDKTTAIYAAMPGGLIEAVTLGEKAGGDIEILSMQHFARIILVVLMVPTFFYISSGQVVGSGAGQSLQSVAPDWTDWVAFLMLAPTGIYLGNRLHLPASHLMGPLILTAAFHASGVLSVTGPSVLLNTAQLIVGAGLGTMFARSTPRHLLTGFGLGAVYVAVVLALGAGFSAVLSRFVPMSFEALMISFAPGGVTEMGLIALSLGVSPVLVMTHHMFRIIFTVSVAGYITKKWFR